MKLTQRRGRSPAGIFLLLCMAFLALSTSARAADNDYAALVSLFEDWRAFENPPLLDGAPDYSAERFERDYPEFEALRDRLHAIDPSEWSIEQQVDWHVVRAEMNGFEFNHKVLKPWVRDPAYYQSIWSYRSDVPAHEGPTHHAVLELWTYEFPLSGDEEARMLADLAVIPPLMRQAQKNLTGNARDLWRAGIRNIETQGKVLEQIREKIASPGPEMTAALDEASAATAGLVSWLKAERSARLSALGCGGHLPSRLRLAHRPPRPQGRAGHLREPGGEGPALSRRSLHPPLPRLLALRDAPGLPPGG